MNAKTTIRKILFVAVWLCIGAGMFTLLLAAISKKNRGECQDYIIALNGVQNNFFIDSKDVEQLLMTATKGAIKGEPVASFKLHELEQMLEDNTWIDEAELYFDNRDVLHITVTEKEPVARLFTISGNSFYIDSLGRKMPLSEKLSARVPVFTGFPDKKKLSAADSILLNDVRMTANYIINDPFWMSQVAQIDITPERNFEMVPVVGNHLVKLGNGDDIQKKFRRLMVFYQQVLSKTGFDKYKVIDVQYKGQVVVSKYAGNAKIDSIQLRRNVEKLLRQSIEAENDTVIRAMAPIVKLEPDSATAADPSLQDKNETNPKSNKSPNPLKSSLPITGEKKENENKTDKTFQTNTAKPKPVKVVTPKPVEKKKEPKAVMPKKTTVEKEDGGYN
ncbi:MAG: cell division protein FtsQ/DivIB [Bacteroidota bacterium]|nr:cell division protein FtsQ/DivIB [Bacteroidota bacterium]